MIRSTMKNSLAMLLAGLYSATFANAQSNSTQEFITASSPLSDGSVVTTTYYPSSTGPVTRIVQPVGVSPNASQATMPTAQTISTQSVQAKTSGNTSGVVSQPSTVPTTISQVVPPTTTSQVVPPTTTYMAHMPDAEQRAILQANQLIRVPTLGYPNTRTALMPGSYSTTQTMRLPTGEVYPYPESQAAPAATIPSLGSTLPMPTVPGPLIGRSPTLQPLLKLQNLPPGTYVGQGIVGQPKAYVDGQPLRNLLRYFSY